MAKVNLLVCENYSPDFAGMCEESGWEDISVLAFPPLCISKHRREEAAGLIKACAASGSDSVIYCGKNCGLPALIPSGADMEVQTADYCFSHLASEPFISYVLAKGGYIIGSGWLKNWRERIAEAGFDRDTAVSFYHDFCRELVFFDTGACAQAENDLAELSQYLDLPYVIIPSGLESLRLMMESLVSGRRMHARAMENSRDIAEIQAQSAEYAAIFDLMGRIAAYANKRDVIEKVKEIFIMVFGARQFRYWNNDLDKDSLEEEIKAFMLENDREYLLLEEENRFCIKIRWQEKFFGAIDVSGFMFPEYIEKYLNFALEIAKICGLVFSNNEQYEKVLRSEQDMRYASTHDALTGLYNRAFLHDVIDGQPQGVPYAVFMFDIDGLKAVNDQDGHAEGDMLIIQAAAILQKCFRETDIVARIGGDEFLAILHGGDTQAAELIADRLRQQIELHNGIRRDARFELSFSIGYAVGEKPADTIETLMKKADELMYIDKMNKRTAKA